MFVYLAQHEEGVKTKEQESGALKETLEMLMEQCGMFALVLSSTCSINAFLREFTMWEAIPHQIVSEGAFYFQ